jgi:hypothetical protein
MRDDLGTPVADALRGAPGCRRGLERLAEPADLQSGEADRPAEAGGNCA